MDNAHEVGGGATGQSRGGHQLGRGVEEGTHELTALLEVAHSLTPTLELEPLLIGDVRREDDPLIHAWRTATSSYRPDLLSPPVRTWMAMPLSVRGQMAGYLALTREAPNSFTVRETELAVAFAGHAAVAIQNASLLGGAELRTRELTALLRFPTTSARLWNWSACWT